ncbi:sensor histidine kinase [Aquimarina sp. MAR_2010_214]|uniref:sensor histidine kinase n=1 Tax=Aquimarina sp. MAR_2010_214 TaxID=1250026 RepID=UPI0011783AE7|nr:histidine kinase [Aquimarina sp. MAR_2010_214]
MKTRINSQLLKFKNIYKKLQIVLVFLLFSVTFCWAQNEESENQESIVSKIKNNTLVKDEQYVPFLAKQLELAKNNNDWESAIVIQNTLAEEGIYSQMNHKAVYDSLKKFNDYIPEIKNTKEVAKYYISYAEAAIYLQKYHASLKILTQATSYLESKKDSLLYEYGYAYLKAAETSTKTNNLINSVTYFKKASDIFLKQKDTVSFLWSQNGLSRLLGNNGLYKEADEVRKPIFLWADIDIINETGVVVMAHITAALQAIMQNDTQKELYHVRQALLFNSQMTSSEKQIVEILNHACATYVFARHDLLKESDENLKKLNNLMIGANDSPFLSTYYTLASSQNAYAHKNFKKAEKGLAKWLKIVKQSKVSENILDYEYLLAQTYESMGNANQSIHHFKSYIRLKDSIQKSTSRKRFAYIQSQFEAEKKDLEIAKQKKHIVLLSVESKLKSQWIIIIVIFLTAIFFITYLIRSKRFQKHQQKLLKQFGQDLLNSIETERKRIASDLHDGIGQNLLVIKNKILLQNENEDVSIVDQTIKEIREISQNIHPYRFEKIGLEASLKNTIKLLQESTSIFFSEEIKNKENIEGMISKEKHLQIYRILQEALNNVLKHSKTSACNLSVYSELEYVNFIVKDNGIGFVFSEANKRSLGMKTMQGRAKMIESILTINSIKNKGTIIHLKVPVK